MPSLSFHPHLALLLSTAVALPAFAQTPSQPVEFAPQVISTGNEFGLTFTPDGHQACFSRSTPNKPTHIFCSQLANGQWQPAQPISFSSDAWYDLDPFFTPDGRHLYFISTRPDSAPGATTPNPPSTNMDIWSADRNGDGWSTPHHLDNINSHAKEGSPTLALDGTLYFFSDRPNTLNSGGPNINSLYRSTLVNGHYATPVQLPAPISSSASDTSPWISPSGKTLLFYSNRPGGFGKGDLYVSTLHRGAWSTPINLGPAVNTPESEYNPSVSPDGKNLYFSRTRRIYTIPVAAIPALKHASLR